MADIEGQGRESRLRRETMADTHLDNLSYRSENVIVNRPNWGAIWAGLFTFVAIWSIFGMLGVGIFASSANANAAAPVERLGAGLGVWGVILTIIAFFVAGRVTGQITGPVGSRTIHAIVMFGLAVSAGFLILMIGGSAFGSAAVANPGVANPGMGNPGEMGVYHGTSLLGMFAGLGWSSFVALFFGCLAAIGGAATAHRQISRPPLPHEQISHA